MSLSKALTDIFDRKVNVGSLSEDAEREAIAAAKAGDSEATVRLMYAYAPALRSAAGKFSNAGGGHDAIQTADREDIHAAITTAFFEAVKAFDPDTQTRLAATLNSALRPSELTGVLSGPVAFTVPHRTLSRFYSILRKADGNPFEAVKIAREHHMSPEVFLSVLSAVRDVNSMDACHVNGDANGEHWQGESSINVRPIWDASTVEEDAELVKAAFAAVNDLEKTVCEMTYGFTDYDPIPDAEIGHRLGFSRAKAQRTRSSALGKMREALAVE
ncbi:DNA binding protein [Arthrobacter phage Niobe]|uniref:DNA binding protein n=1 Tax=Arthrobacter phage Elezi TaxID=2762410 RepID=A0A7G8LH20_9CAUD|nr:RNA polymerase sigma factor [Arthrobacter phage Elezi]QNJ56542.1 DNA binding protein [Arthrobacter phage Elezi]QOP64345.1 DNA binding protein [Arthrobacter phage London]UAJ15403.2 DNA binding protein [Arthrobacter phage Asa16]